MDGNTGGAIPSDLARLARLSAGARRAGSGYSSLLKPGPVSIPQGTLLKKAFETSACLFCRDSGFQSSHDLQPPERGLSEAFASGQQPGLQREGQREVRRLADLQRSEKSCRSHTNHGDWNAVHMDDLSDHIGIGCEAALPIAIRNHGHRVALTWSSSIARVRPRKAATPRPWW